MSHKKALVVEDNHLNLKLFHDLLKIHNFEVVLSNDGVGVLEIAQKELPDIILMDIQLSGISGIDLIQELKGNSLTCQIPIIAISAFAMKNDEAKILSSGCDLYLSKPVSLDLFFKSIDRFIPTNSQEN